MMCCMQAVLVKSVRHDVLYVSTCSEDMMCCMQELIVKCQT